MPDATSFFAVKRLVVFSNAVRVFDRRFHPGVNIIRGDNGSGKSSIADFIFYVLGGEFDQWKKKAALCTEVRAELLTSEGVLTLRRLVGTKKEAISVFFGPMDDERAGIPEHWERFSLQRTDRHLSFTQALFRACHLPDAPAGDGSNITAHQLLRLLYADQRTPAPRLFRFESFDTREIRIAVGELLLGVNSYELYETQIELRAARKLFDEAHSELTAFLKSIPSRHAAVKPEEVEAEVQAFEQERARILAAIEGIGAIEPDEMDREHDAARQRANESLRRQRRDRKRLEDEVEKIDLELDELHLFIDHLEENLQKITVNASFAEVLGAIDFSYCPSCLSPISTAPETGCCAVCTRPVDPDKQGARYLEIQLDTSHQIRESRQLLEAKSLKRDQLAANIRRMRSEIRRARDEFSVQFELSETPRAAQLAELYGRLGEIGELIKQAADRRELADRFKALAETRDSAQAEQSRLERRVEVLTAEGAKRTGSALTDVGDTARSLLTGDLPRQEEFKNPQQVVVDFGDDAVMVDGAMNFAESSNVVLKNTALLALLSAASRDEKFWHPRFLLMDNIEDKGMEPRRSHNFQKLIVREIARAKTPVQVILTTSMPDPDLEQTDLVIGPAFTESNSTLNFNGVPPSVEPDRFITKEPEYTDFVQRNLDEAIASALGIDLDTLDSHPYHIEEYASDDDLVYSWWIIWEEGPPPGVEVFGDSSRQWTEILPIDDEPDYLDEPPH